jgi:uncharacterized membrane protein YfcA
VLEPWQWAVAALGAYLVGVSKTGIAGLGVFAVALFASVLPARESVGIVLVVLLAADLVAVTAYRNDVSWAHLVRLFPWAAVGILIGFLIMGRIDALTTQRLIGVILVVLTIFQFIRQRMTSGQALEQAMASKPHPAAAAVTGIGAGITTMIANAGGPIMVLYLLAMRLPKLLFMGTSAWFFFVLNVFKVPFNVQLGLINAESLRISLPLAPFAILGALSGRLLIHRIDQKLFELLALVLTLLAGLRLLMA